MADLNYGIYYVKVKSEDTLRSKTWTICVHKVSTTGVDEKSNPLGISLYPNPANSKLNVQSLKDIKGEIIVSDMLGKEKLHSRINGQKEEMDITGLNSGMYILTIQGNGYTSVQKFVKE